MYIMCVILCLFSALSRGVGALQISVIIIMISHKQTGTNTSTSHFEIYAFDRFDELLEGISYFMSSVEVLTLHIFCF